MAQSITESPGRANNKHEKIQRLIVTSVFSGEARIRAPTNHEWRDFFKVSVRRVVYYLLMRRRDAYLAAQSGRSRRYSPRVEERLP